MNFKKIISAALRCNASYFESLLKLEQTFDAKQWNHIITSAFMHENKEVCDILCCEAIDERIFVAASLRNAAYTDCTRLVKFWLDHGMSVVDLPDKEHRRIFQWPIMNDNIAMLQLLLDRGANLRPQMLWDCIDYCQRPTVLCYLQKRGLNVKQVLKSDPKEAQESFDMLISFERPEMMQLLVSHNMNLNYIGYEGDTPLTSCIRNEKTFVADLLLDSPTIDVDMKNADGYCPLYFCIDIGFIPQCALKMLDMGANVEAIDANNNTLLCTAVCSNDVDFCDLLLIYGAKVTARDYRDATNYNGNSTLTEHMCNRQHLLLATLAISLSHLPVLLIVTVAEALNITLPFHVMWDVCKRFSRHSL